MKSAGEAGVCHFMYNGLEFVIGNKPRHIDEIGPHKEFNPLEVKTVLDNNVDSTNTIQDDDKSIDLGQLALSDPEAYEDYVSGTHDG